MAPKGKVSGAVLKKPSCLDLGATEAPASGENDEKATKNVRDAASEELEAVLEEFRKKHSKNNKNWHKQ